MPTESKHIQDYSLDKIMPSFTSNTITRKIIQTRNNHINVQNVSKYLIIFLACTFTEFSSVVFLPRDFAILAVI